MSIPAEKWTRRVMNSAYPAWNCKDCAREYCEERNWRYHTKRGVCWLFNPTDEAVLHREVLLECDRNPRARELQIRRFFE